MKKRIIAIVVMAVMALSVFAFTGCDLSSDLTEYKATAEAAIQRHADTKIAENDYTEQGLEAIATAVVDGKEAVKNATTRASITTERDKAIQTIDEVPKENDIVNQVKQTYVDSFLKEDYPQATIADVTVTIYLGTYNGSFVAVINDKFNWLFPEYVIELIIEGFDFSYSYGYPIRVWNDGNFYLLQTAYGHDLLTKGNLETIHNIYYNKSSEGDMAEILNQFDLSDPKVLWKGSILDDFADDVVILTLRKTTYYHELKLRHFGLDNAESLEYVGAVRPPDFYFEEGNEEMLALFRQTVFITLKQHGKAKVVEAIAHLEGLDFVHSAYPNRLNAPGG